MQIVHNSAYSKGFKYLVLFAPPPSLNYSIRHAKPQPHTCRTFFCVSMTATYISKSVREAFSVSRVLLRSSSFCCISASSAVVDIVDEAGPTTSPSSLLSPVNTSHKIRRTGIRTCLLLRFNMQNRSPG